MPEVEHQPFPAWMSFLLTNPLRRLWEDPKKMLGPHVEPGMRVLEPGPGPGFFTLPLARMVGAEGKVVAVDMNEQMVEKLRSRVAKAGLTDRVDIRVNEDPASLGIRDLKGTMDLVVALHVVHEMPDLERFFNELLAALRPEGRVLMIEPKGQVSEEEFAESLVTAVEIGFECKGLETRRALLSKS